MAESRYVGSKGSSGSRYAKGGGSYAGSRYAAPSPSFGSQFANALKNDNTVQGVMGAGRRIVDVWSRGMFASAGAAEEAFSPVGGGLPEVLPRVGREIFSGLPFTDIQGDKREFIEVMERAGVPELGHLSDVIGPFTPMVGGLVGPGKFDPSVRGMIGFAADVALDPATWVTSGGSTIGRFATSKGVLWLNKRGLLVKEGFVRELSPTLRMLDQANDLPVVQEMGRRQVREVLENKVSIAVAQDPSLLQKTGLKIAGMEVVSPRLVKNLTKPVKAMIESAPWGARAARVAEAWGDGLRTHFDAFADLAHLDESAKEGVKNKIRDYQNAVAANNHRDAQGWDLIRADEAKLAKKYGSGDAGVQALGKKFSDWREGTAQVSLTPAEEDLFARAAANYDQRGITNVRNGAISGEQFDKYQGRYLRHDYKNKEVLSEQMVRQAVADGLLPATRLGKERQFETLAEAVRVSRDLEKEGKLARGRGAVRQMYGELIPEYSISKNLWSHIEQSNRAIFEKKLFADIEVNYGLKLDEFYDPAKVREIHEPIHVPEADSKIIDEFVQEHKSLKELAESFDFTRVTVKTPEWRGAQRRMAEVLKSAPIKYYEKQTLKNIDEFRYYKRRGWDIVEEGDGKYVAYKTNDVGTAEYVSWNSKVKKARAEIEAATERAGRDVRTGHEGWDNLTTESKKILPKLSPDGQREFSRQLTSMARDESHILNVREAVGEALMPPVKALKAGDINPFFLQHGLPEGKARLVTRGGGVWGDQPHLIPQAIADMLDDAPRDMLANAKGELGPLVKSVDKVGNLFKGITYPGYPAGAFRDTYNNLQQGFLALGVNSLTRPDLAARIRFGGEGLIEIGVLKKTAAQWKKLSESIRVVDPSASSFVQTTGKKGAEKASLYSKARAFRGQFDNATRTQLWVAGMRMGMTPEDAGRMVQQWLYNYAELAPFERDVLRRAFPFIVFPLKTIKLYPGAMLKNPGRFATMNKMFMGRDSENSQMTTWEGEGYKIRLDRDGKNLTVLNGVDLPVRSFDMLYSGSWTKTLERLVGSSNPIPKVFYMLSSGRDPFRGREMTRASVPTIGRMLEGAPKWFRDDWLGWKKKTDAAGRPIYTVNEAKYRDTLEIMMLSRVFSTSDVYFRDQMREAGASDWWLKFFTGLQLKTLNLSEEKKRKLADMERIATEAKVKQGELGQGHYTFKPKGQ